jgi:hypothetical protein
MKPNAIIEWGLVVAALVLLGIGIFVGLDSWVVLASVLVGLAAVWVGGFSFFGGRRKQ